MFKSIRTKRNNGSDTCVADIERWESLESAIFSLEPAWECRTWTEYDAVGYYWQY